MLAKRKLDYVRLDGSVPQKKRQQLVNRFREDPRCRLFITTNAGSTGLNLQAANTVINVDLPWNPAVLEQRIGRAHRMGQQQPVQVYVLVTEETIEENLLTTLSAKHDLALAALDPDSDVTQVDLTSGVEELRRRLEVLLGAQPEAPLDVTQQGRGGPPGRAARRAPRPRGRRRRRDAGRGVQLPGRAGLAGRTGGRRPSRCVAQVRGRLTECVEEDASGRPRLTVTLPDRRALDALAQTLARAAGRGRGRQRRRWCEEGRVMAADENLGKSPRTRARHAVARRAARFWARQRSSTLALISWCSSVWEEWLSQAARRRQRNPSVPTSSRSSVFRCSVLCPLWHLVHC